MRSVVDAPASIRGGIAGDQTVAQRDKTFFVNIDRATKIADVVHNDTIFYDRPAKSLDQNSAAAPVRDEGNPRKIGDIVF